MSDSSLPKIAIAALVGAGLTLAVVKLSAPGPAVESAPTASAGQAGSGDAPASGPVTGEPGAAGAELAAEASPAALPPGATASEAWPALPEVGQAAPTTPPPVRIPANAKELQSYLDDVEAAVGKPEAQRALRAARWTLEIPVGPLAGRVVADLDDDLSVVRHAAQDAVLVQAGESCTLLRKGAVAPCELHEEVLLAALRHARAAALPAIWRHAFGRLATHALDGSTNVVHVGANAGNRNVREKEARALPHPDGGRDLLAVDARNLQVRGVSSIGGICPRLAFDGWRRVRDFAVPSHWRAELETPNPAAAPDASAADADPVGRQRAAWVCGTLELLVLDVAALPGGVQRPALAPGAAESAPRFEQRIAQKLNAVALQRVGDFSSALPTVVPSSGALDRRGRLGGFVVAKDGLALAVPLLEGADGPGALAMPAGPVARQRMRVKPTLLVATLQQFAETLRAKRPLGDGPWMAWPLEIDPGFVFANDGERMFELEVPVAP